MSGEEKSPSATSASRGFLLAACQAGAEEALLQRQGELLPNVARGAWRRGFVTFRLPAGFDPPQGFFPDLIFARTLVHSLGQVTGGSVDELARSAATLAGRKTWQEVHVWHRVQQRRTSPSAEPLVPSASELRAAVRSALGMAISPVGANDVAGESARPGDLVLDLVVDSPTRVWTGWHLAASPPSCWPGGLYPHPLPPTAASRAWLKLDEAIATFELPLQSGEKACELGAAPGGACQRLLEGGLQVVGIDPAVLDPRVASHPRFEHWRMRARDVKLRRFRGFDWIISDMNIDPSSTIAALERIVSSGVSLRGIVATLKLPHWSRAEELPGWSERVESWGFTCRIRQLSTGGREVCMVATSRR